MLRGAHAAARVARVARCALTRSVGSAAFHASSLCASPSAGAGDSSAEVLVHRMHSLGGDDEGKAQQGRKSKLNAFPFMAVGIIVISLNRAHARNAIGKQLLSELRDSLSAFEAAPGARCLVIRSLCPGVFSAGADLKERRMMGEAEARGFVDSLRSAFSTLEALPMPTIAAIEGAALGGGMELALACDLRIGERSSRFALPETGLGIIPGAGGTQRLPRLIGHSAAKEMVFTGRSVGGEEAARLGLLNECAPEGEAMGRAMEVAHSIARRAPVAQRMAKAAISAGGGGGLEEGAARERACYERVLGTRDRLEALEAFAEKREPVFRGE